LKQIKTKKELKGDKNKWNVNVVEKDL
jgi:hypothetical protein